MAKLEKILVPDIGDYDGVEIIEVSINVGDTVVVDAPLITLETDKATVEVPSPFAGIIKEVKVKVGDMVSENSLVALIELAGQTSQEETKKSEEKKPETKKVADEVKEEKKLKEEKIEVPKNSDLIYASPAVRRLAFELDLNLSTIKGTGEKGRITKDDLKNHLGAGSSSGSGISVSSAPNVDFSKFGEIETRPLSRIQKISGAHLHRNWVTIPHVTQFDEADITELEEFRKNNKVFSEKQGVKLTPLVFIMQAVVKALQVFPNFNSSLINNGADLVIKKYFHIGVAVDTPNGLVVPVVRDVNNKSLLDLARELGEISSKARDGKLSGADMQGGTFSISSLGGISGTGFTPIVNAPEVAILGVSRSKITPTYVNGNLEPRLILPLSLSYDHRVIDGAEAARFIKFLSEQLQDIRRILL